MDDRERLKKLVKQADDLHTRLCRRYDSAPPEIRPRLDSLISRAWYRYRRRSGMTSPASDSPSSRPRWLTLLSRLLVSQYLLKQ